MFFRLLLESFLRQRRRKLLAGLAILLGTTAVTTMLALGTSIGDQINRELSAYGANIVVYPKADTLDVQVGGVDIKPASSGAYLRESDLPKLKGIFWRNNITAISPELPVTAHLEALPSGAPSTSLDVPAVGVWFHHTVRYGEEEMVTGAPAMHPWWKLQGTWPDDSDAAQQLRQKGFAEAARTGLPTDNDSDEYGVVLGAALAARLRLRVGDSFSLLRDARVTGIVTAGDDTDNQLLIPLYVAQSIADHPGAVRRVYLSALTKPEDAFARRNPDSLSPAERDKWYCSPYANSIAYQVNEAMPAGQAEQIRRVAQSEGQILSRISGLMWLVTIASLVAASFAVSSAMATALLARRREIGLMRSLGATNTTVSTLFFLEQTILALIGGAFGFLLGSALASRIGHQIFGAGIPLNPVLLPIILTLALLVAIAGSIGSVRSALRLDPAAVLRADA